MTLMELLVALVVLGLISALAFSNIGPWLSQSRASASEASLWRGISSTQLVMGEFAAGAIDPTARRFDAAHANFRALVPRLSATPVHASFSIMREASRSTLSLTVPELSQDASVLIESAAPLRFSDRDDQTLVLELQRGGVWAPIVVVNFPADAPFVCAFDPIPRTCRQ